MVVRSGRASSPTGNSITLTAYASPDTAPAESPDATTLPSNIVPFIPT